MEPREHLECTAFAGTRVVANGGLAEVIRAARSAEDADSAILIFDDETGEVVEVDLRGSVDDVLARLMPGDPPTEEAPRGPGRPRLGVVSREVTLLPRHWAWLNGQPGGASVALRTLVEEASRARAGLDRARRTRDAAYRFLSAMAGDLPGFEEAIRALFAGDAEKYRRSAAEWPADIREYGFRIAEPAFRGA